MLHFSNTPRPTRSRQARETQPITPQPEAVVEFDDEPTRPDAVVLAEPGTQCYLGDGRNCRGDVALLRGDIPACALCRRRAGL